MKILLSMLLALITMPLEAKKIKVGIFYVGPHMVVQPDNTKHEGLAVKHFEEIAQRMGIDAVTFIAYPFPRMIYALEHNQIDAALLLAKNGERSKRFVYPQEPYYSSRSAIAVRDDFPLSRIKTVEDILPFTIGVTAKVYLTPMMRDERISYEKIASGKQIYKQQFSKLDVGRIDAVYMPDIEVLKYEASRLGYSHFRYILLPELPTLIYTVFSKQSAGEYLDDYQSALKQQNVALTYEELLELSLSNQ